MFRINFRPSPGTMRPILGRKPWDTPIHQSGDGRSNGFVRTDQNSGWMAIVNHPNQQIW